MKLIIDQKIIERFSPIIGVVTVNGCDNTGKSVDINALLRATESEVQAHFTKLKTHSDHPHIQAWRQVYKTFGTDPHQYRASVEALIRRVLKGDNIPHINKLVNIYNYISLKYLLPVGGEDIDTIRGDLHLAFADGFEEFVRLNGSDNDPPNAGEIIYKDDVGVICRRWNWREADRTKLTERTRNAIIAIDAVPPTTHGLVEQAMNELAQLVQKYCGGTVKTEILGK